MRSRGMCALAPKLLELGAKKRITQELGRAASGASQEFSSSALELRVYS